MMKRSQKKSQRLMSVNVIHFTASKLNGFMRQSLAHLSFREESKLVYMCWWSLWSPEE